MTPPGTLTPEELARVNIDVAMEEAGWVIQDRDQMNLAAGPGVAIREFQTDAGPCDYLLFVNKKPAGVIEAKKKGVLRVEGKNYVVANGDVIEIRFSV